MSSDDEEMPPLEAPAPAPASHAASIRDAESALVPKKRKAEEDSWGSTSVYSC